MVDSVKEKNGRGKKKYRKYIKPLTRSERGDLFNLTGAKSVHVRDSSSIEPYYIRQQNVLLLLLLLYFISFLTVVWRSNKLWGKTKDKEDKNFVNFIKGFE